MKWLVARSRLDSTLNARTGVPVKAHLKYPEKELGEISSISVKIFHSHQGFTLKLIKLLKRFPKCSTFNTSSIESISCMLAP